MDADSLDPDVLAARCDWVRALAQRLVRDPGLAEDVAQDAWLTALRGRAPEPRAPWLSGVVRHVAQRALRSRSRRERRHREALPLTPAPTPAEVHEREASRRRVVEALLALREPFRSTLLLRYYEDLEPARIAAAMGVPPATVRTRLHRGLSELRAQLTDERDDVGWLRGLALGAAWPSADTGARAGLGAGFLLGAKALAGLAACAVAAVAWAVFAATPPAPPVRPLTPPTLVVQAEREEGAVDEAREERRAPVPAPSTVPASADVAAWHLSRALPEGGFQGVVQTAFGVPVAAARVVATPSSGGMRAGFELDDARRGRAFAERTDARGAFAFSDLPGGPYALEVTLDDGMRGNGFAFAGPEAPFVLLTVLEDTDSSAVRALTVLAVDDGGHGVAGAQVLVHGPDGARLERTCDGDGRARFDDVELGRAVVLVDAGDDLVGRVDLRTPADVRRKRELRAGPDGAPEPVLVVHLAPPGRLAGSVAGASVGARVVAWARSRPDAAYAAVRVPFAADVDAAGRFAFDALAAGTYALTVDDPGGRRLELDRARADAPWEPATVEVVAGGTAHVQLALTVGPRLTGRVVRAEDGAPLAGARVHVELPQGLASDPDRVRRAGVHLWRLDSVVADLGAPLVDRVTTTDDDGVYRFDGLPPGDDWRIEVQCAGRSYDRRDPVRLADGEVTSLEHALVRAGGVQGVAPSWSNLALKRVGDEWFTASFLTPRSAIAPFTVLGLAPGTWEVFDVHSDERRAPARLAEFEVRAGELAWLDLMGAGPYLARGRLTLRGRPVADAMLSFLGPVLRTDATGRFAFPYSFPYAGDRILDITLGSEPDAVPLRAHAPGMCAGGTEERELALPEGALDVVVLGAPHGLRVELELRHTPPPDSGIQRGLGAAAESDRPPGGVAFEASAGWRPVQRSTDEAGRARFDVLPAGGYVVSASAGTTFWPRASLALADGEARTVTLELGEGGALRLTALDARRAPLPRSTVYMEQIVPEDAPSTEQSWSRTFVTDDEGVLALDHVPPGDYRVSLERAGWEDAPPTTAVHVAGGAVVEVELAR